VNGLKGDKYFMVACAPLKVGFRTRRVRLGWSTAAKVWWRMDSPPGDGFQVEPVLKADVRVMSIGPSSSWGPVSGSFSEMTVGAVSWTVGAVSWTVGGISRCNSGMESRSPDMIELVVVAGIGG
jgi:hypothetical protein